ncbi:MAG: hypothetical protein PHU68_00510 [Paludibacter sp.]|nr:hypothetical protein [Paludibacter sp.]
MRLHDAIEKLSVIFPNQGKQGVHLPTIRGRVGCFFKVCFNTDGPLNKLQIESSTGKSWAEITEYYWDIVYARYMSLDVDKRAVTSQYGNSWNDQPEVLNRNITPYLAGLIHYLLDETYRQLKNEEVMKLNKFFNIPNNLDRVKQILEDNSFRNQVVELQQVQQLPAQAFMVYLLFADDQLIVAGAGKKNRARVIFDDQTTRTNGHIKALKVRLYHRYTESTFMRIIIHCSDKEESKRIENVIHKAMGGNNLNLPPTITTRIDDILDEAADPCLKLLVKIAIMSSFDGLNDLQRWRAHGLIDDLRWTMINEVFGEL